MQAATLVVEADLAGLDGNSFPPAVGKAVHHGHVAAEHPASLERAEIPMRPISAGKGGSAGLHCSICFLRSSWRAARPSASFHRLGRIGHCIGWLGSGGRAGVAMVVRVTAGATGTAARKSHMAISSSNTNISPNSMAAHHHQGLRSEASRQPTPRRPRTSGHDRLNSKRCHGGMHRPCKVRSRQFAPPLAVGRPGDVVASAAWYHRHGRPHPQSDLHALCDAGDLSFSQSPRLKLGKVASGLPWRRIRQPGSNT
jgi:hypothetical protein